MSRPRERVSGLGLLPGMEARPRASGGFTYRWKPHGATSWVNLGTDRQAALATVIAASGRATGHGTVRWLWEQWSTKSPRFARLAPNTQADYATAWKRIDKTLGNAAARAITPTIVARYVHVERAEHPRRANIEKAVLSGMFKYGILLGVNSTNPTIGVEAHPNEASVVMPETLALARFARWLDASTGQRRVLSQAMRFVALEGSRQCEFLRTTWMQVGPDAVRLIRAKQRGGKREQVVELVEITPPLRALLNEIKALHAHRDVPYLFPTDEGNAYSARGFKTLFQRAIVAALDAGIVTTRFNFHSLRRYYATMHKAEHGKLPDLHANPAVTAAIYDGTRTVKRKALNK
jgi:integrase